MAMDRKKKTAAKKTAPAARKTSSAKASNSKTATGRHLSAETKAKISKSMMGNTNGRGNKKS